MPFFATPRAEINFSGGVPPLGSHGCFLAVPIQEVTMRVAILALIAALACSGSCAFAKVGKPATTRVRHHEAHAVRGWVDERGYVSPGMTTGSGTLRGPASRSASEDAGVLQMDSTPSGE